MMGRGYCLCSVHLQSGNTGHRQRRGFDRGYSEIRASPPVRHLMSSASDEARCESRPCMTGQRRDPSPVVAETFVACLSVFERRL
jgi:hypothetical protein